MVVYRVKKSKVMLELISETDRDLKLSISSLDFLMYIKLLYIRNFELVRLPQAFGGVRVA